MATPPTFSAGAVLTAAQMNQLGMFLIASQAVGSTAVGSVVVPDVFSSDFDDYLITWQGGTMSGDTALKMQLGSTASGCFGAFIHTPNYAGTSVQNAGDVNTAMFTYAGGGNSSGAGMNVFLSGPNKPNRTFITGGQVSYLTVFGTYNGVEVSATQHTDFTLVPFTGTMVDGTIRVYGYRN
jgi:hypothetical protein